jgi:homoserine kinase
LSVTVRVPATSANLGPGFDALAVAVDLPLVVRSTPRQEARVRVAGEGAGELAATDENLVWRALVAWCEQSDATVPDISLEMDNTIPLERGLGSSAAAAVAGGALGRALTGGGSDAALIDLATGFDGHRDNAAAAVLGGLIIAYDGKAVRVEPTTHLRPLLAVPEQRAATADARRLLAENVPLRDAAANAARTATVLAGLSGAAGWDPAAMHDVLHEPARFAAMPDSGRLVSTLREAGLAACLSGAGPSVLVVAEAGDLDAGRTLADAAPAGWQVLELAWELSGVTVTEPDIDKVRAT